MSQRLWPVTGSTPEELRQALIDRIVQATLECSEAIPTRSQKGSKHRERMIEALFQAAAADAGGR